jgi:hypothetical protein
VKGGRSASQGVEGGKIEAALAEGVLTTQRANTAEAQTSEPKIPVTAA